MRINLIVAADLDDCIGRSNTLPWRLPSDLRRFKHLTLDHHLIAGRNTQDSIVARIGGPLPGRITYVLSRTAEPNTGISCSFSHIESLMAALEQSVPADLTNDVFLIGGAATYSAFLPHVSRILLTRVHARVNGDTFMPRGWLGGFTQTEADGARLRDERDEYETSYTTYERWQNRG